MSTKIPMSFFFSQSKQNPCWAQKKTSPGCPVAVANTRQRSSPPMAETNEVPCASGKPIFNDSVEQNSKTLASMWSKALGFKQKSQSPGSLFYSWGKNKDMVIGCHWSSTCHHWLLQPIYLVIGNWSQLSAVLGSQILLSDMHSSMASPLVISNISSSAMAGTGDPWLECGDNATVMVSRRIHYPLVISNSHGKWSIIDDLPRKNGKMLTDFP